MASPVHRRIRVVIAGGGCAGLASLITLRRHEPAADLVLIDPAEAHLRLPRLHESLRRPLAELRVPFALIAHRFQCRHVRTALEFDEDVLLRLQCERRIRLEGRYIDFDYLILATGHRPVASSTTGSVNLDTFRHQEGRHLVKELLSRTLPPQRIVTVVGGGPTGLQFLFELSAITRSWHERFGLELQLRLVHAEELPLNGFPPAFGQYALECMAREGIEYVGNAVYQGRSGADRIVLRDRPTGAPFTLPSQVEWLFTGCMPNPMKIRANPFGQVMLEDGTLGRIFVAGDCSEYAGNGSNRASVLTAIHKGKRVAENLLRLADHAPNLEPYAYTESAHVVPLGESDGIASLTAHGPIVTGWAARLLFEAQERRQKLFLSGYDTYGD
jgi:NADH dehydrogenase